MFHRFVMVSAMLLLPAAPALAICQLPSCIQVQDGNTDGDLTAEFQQAVNALVYPNGVLTTEASVTFEPPPAGEYFLSDTVRICFDSSPPLAGGEDVGDCTGIDSSGAFPEIRTAGAWDQVTLRCSMATFRTKQRLTYGCLHIGDAFVDATSTSLGPLVGVDFSAAPLRMTMEDPGITNINIVNPVGFGMSALLCDGCSGAIAGHFTMGGDFGISFPSSVLTSSGVHAVGPNLTVTGSVDTAPGFAGRTPITFDGDVSGSGLAGSITTTGTILVGSHTIMFNGPTDGCNYGAFDGTCSGWQLFEGAVLDAEGDDAGALWFTEWNDVRIDGELRHTLRAGRLQSFGGHLFDVKSAINLNEAGVDKLTLPAHGRFTLGETGSCQSTGVTNSCIRVLNSESLRDPAFPTEIILEGYIDRRGLRDAPKPEMGTQAIDGGIVVLPGADVVVGSTFRYEGVNSGVDGRAGNFFTSDRRQTAALRGDATNSLGLSVTVDLPSIDPSALPLCLAYNGSGAWPCSDKRTKVVPGLDSYLSATHLVVDANVAPTTACALRWRVAGDCVGCQKGEIFSQTAQVIESLDGATADPAWSFVNATASDDVTTRTEGAASLRLVADSAGVASAQWAPTTPLNLKREYFLYDLWTDPNETTDAALFEHAHFTDFDGFRLRLADSQGNASEWHYGGPAGSAFFRLATPNSAGWVNLLLQHWFEPPTTATGILDVEDVVSVRFEFNHVAPESGRTLRIDNLRTLFREGEEIRYGHEFTHANFPYRTQQIGDEVVRQVPGRVPAGNILQLELAAPTAGTCAAGSGCVCDALQASITGGLIVVNDQGERFDRVAAGFDPGGPLPGPPSSCGLGSELALALPFLAWLRRRRHPPKP